MTRKGAWWSGVAFGAAAIGLAVFVLLGLVLASTQHPAAPSVSRVSLPGIAAAATSVAALGWASWAR